MSAERDPVEAPTDAGDWGLDTELESGEGEPAPPPRASGLVGRVLDGKYRLLRLVGQGGMGAVFEAEHTTIGSRVAIKVLYHDVAQRKENLLRFRREAQAAGTIGHPGIVKVHDLGQTADGTAYLVMEFVEGRSLARIIDREGALPVERAFRLAAQVLEALAAAHAQGIVHRDVKPENVLVTGSPGDASEEARVLDFGISKFRQLGPEAQGLTRTGTILGTPLFMAPEQARGETDIDHRVDIYAVGAMLYVMLSGHLPFEAPNYNALVTKIITASPEPLDSLRPGLDGRTVAIVEKAMAREPADRFATAEELAGALRGGGPPLDRAARPGPASAREAPRRGLWGLAAALALLAGLATAFFLWPHSGGGQGDRVPQAYLPGIVTTIDAAAAAPASDEARADAAARRPDGPDGGAAAPQEISIRLTTVPPDAEVFINGQRVPNPVEERRLRAPGETLVVLVSAPGHAQSRRAYERSEDILDTIILDRIRRPTKAAPPRGPRVKTAIE